MLKTESSLECLTTGGHKKCHFKFKNYIIPFIIYPPLDVIDFAGKPLSRVSAICSLL